MEEFTPRQNILLAMAKRKAGSLGLPASTSSRKKSRHEEPVTLSKPSLLNDSDSSSSSEDESVGGVELDSSAFKVNEEYAKRFEHNKKREELHRCQYLHPNYQVGY